MKNKERLTIIIGLAFTLLCMFCLEMNFKKAVNDCSKKHDAEWCINELAK
jgi:hypothetical protein